MKVSLVLLVSFMTLLPSLAHSNVDNCCQIGRTCATDEDWIQGWHDYAAGQCPITANIVDNCCEVGRACATEADWEKGWYDFWADQCNVSTGVVGVSSASERVTPLVRDAYTFVGQGKDVSNVFPLTPGKWSFSTVVENGYTLLFAVDPNTSRYDPSRQCLAWPYWYVHLGDGAWSYRLRLPNSRKLDLIVRSRCDVALSFFHHASVDETRDRTYKVFLTKVDGNY